MAETRDALNALASILGATTATGQDAMAGAWVYPDEYADVNLSTLPAIVVTEKAATINQWGAKSSGVGYHRWMAEVLLFLYKGAPVHPSKQAAEAELLQEGWVKAFGGALADNLRLNDTVVKIGAPDGDFPLKYFDYSIEYLQWNQQEYWGIYFQIPMMQYVDQAMSV